MTEVYRVGDLDEFPRENPRQFCTEDFGISLLNIGVEVPTFSEYPQDNFTM